MCIWSDFKHGFGKCIGVIKILQIFSDFCQQGLVSLQSVAVLGINMYKPLYKVICRTFHWKWLSWSDKSPPVPISNATESICYTNFNLTVATDHLPLFSLELRTTVDLSKRGLDDDDFVFLEERWDAIRWSLGWFWGSDKTSLTDKLTSCSGFKKLDALVQDYYPWKLQPRKLIWNRLMKVWKMIFLWKWVIFRFHVDFPGCIYLLLVFVGSLPLVASYHSATSQEWLRRYDCVGTPGSHSEKC